MNEKYLKQTFLEAIYNKIDRGANRVHPFTEDKEDSPKTTVILKKDGVIMLKKFDSEMKEIKPINGDLLLLAQVAFNSVFSDPKSFDVTYKQIEEYLGKDAAAQTFAVLSADLEGELVLLK